jgi:hypothetical protein
MGQSLNLMTLPDGTLGMPGICSIELPDAEVCDATKLIVVMHPG